MKWGRRTLASFEKIWRLPLTPLMKSRGCSSKLVTIAPSFYDACNASLILMMMLQCCAQSREEVFDLGIWILTFDGSSSSLDDMVFTHHTFLELVKFLDLPIQAHSVWNDLWELKYAIPWLGHEPSWSWSTLGWFGAFSIYKQSSNGSLTALGG